MNIGFAFCGSFCNHPQVVERFEALAKEHTLIPIVSEHAAEFSTRFGTAEELIERLERASGRAVIRDIVAAEPFGPKNYAEVLVIAPCTGNTLAKLAHGITDGAVTMAAKAHLRNGKPLVIAPATNDGLSASLENIARLLNRKNVYFVPFGQDDPALKPSSLIADFSLILPTVMASLEGRQLQPLLLRK